MCFQNCPSENYYGECDHSGPGPRACVVEEVFADAEARAAGIETDIICPVCLDEAGEISYLRLHDHGEYMCPEPACGSGYTPAELAHALSRVATECHARAGTDNEIYDELESLREMRRALEKCLTTARSAA